MPPPHTLVRCSEARGIAPSGLTVKSVGAAPPTLTVPSPQVTGGCDALLVVNVTTGSAGTFDLVVDDASGAEYDKKTFTSVQPAHLGFADSWPSPTLVFAGSTQFAHADTLGPQGEELRGTGAVHFTLGGALVSAPARRATAIQTATSSTSRAPASASDR